MDLTYTTNIPASNHNPSNDQPLMETNTNSIYTIIGIDHFGFNDSNAYGGWHQQVTYPVTRSDPSPLPSGVASMLYTKTISGVAQLFFANANGTNAVGGFSTLASTNGGVDLPGGIKMRWGQGTITNTTSVTVSYATAGLTALTTTYSVVAQWTSTTREFVRTDNYTASGFNFGTDSQTSGTFSYIAIGT